MRKRGATSLLLATGLGGGALLAAFAASCSFPSSDARTLQTALPDESTFAPVAELLSVRCGSIDCHGSVFRNLRVYGSTGLRYLASDRPLSPLCNTCEEDRQTYLSVVGLQPEAMSEVAMGADPSILTMVGRARGTEAHKGGQVWSEGDDSDVCLTSWLEGKVDSADCKSGVNAALSPADPSDDPLLACFSAGCAAR
jgi:hypothetical protein